MERKWGGGERGKQPPVCCVGRRAGAARGAGRLGGTAGHAHVRRRSDGSREEEGHGAGAGPRVSERGRREEGRAAVGPLAGPKMASRLGFRFFHFFLSILFKNINKYIFK
jgi:hypothetical protein